MEVHKRTPQQLAAQAEAATEGTGVFDEKSAETVSMNAPEVLTEDLSRPMGIKLVDLVEEVISELGRVDVFDADSLKALRATCTALRDLVDATGSISTAIFDLKDDHGLGRLETWATRSRLARHTRSLSIKGEMPKNSMDQVLAALFNQRPPISKLDLDFGTVAAYPLLTAPLDTLRELRLASVYPGHRSLIQAINNPAFNSLQSLSLERVYGIDASDFAAVLAHFRDLQSLKLSSMYMKGTRGNLAVLQNALSRLESLEVNNGTDVEKLGLLSAQGPALPALRSLELCQCGSVTIIPCLGHLTKLSLQYARLGSPEVVAALSGGPLVDLRLSLGSDYDSYNHWNWDDLELPHLTRLELPFYPGDAMGDVARATLPALRSVALPFGHSTTVSSVEAFAAAFLELGKLKLDGKWNPTPAANALEALFREIVPLLESLHWHAAVNANKLSALLQSLLPVGTAYGAPRWPCLRSLDLDLGGMWHVTPKIQIDAYQCLARAASHMPALVSLRAVFGGDPRPEALDAFVATAKEVQAWPLLRNIRVRRPTQDISNITDKLQEVWPQATVELWS